MPEPFESLKRAEVGNQPDSTNALQRESELLRTRPNLPLPGQRDFLDDKSDQSAQEPERLALSGGLIGNTWLRETNFILRPQSIIAAAGVGLSMPLIERAAAGGWTVTPRETLFSRPGGALIAVAGGLQGYRDTQLLLSAKDNTQALQYGIGLGCDVGMIGGGLMLLGKVGPKWLAPGLALGSVAGRFILDQKMAMNEHARKR